MKTEQLKKGGHVTHSHSEFMVNLAKKALVEYFMRGARQPSDFDTDFCGEIGNFVNDVWRRTPFYPALARLVDEDKVVFGWLDGKIWYGEPGTLPKGAAPQPDSPEIVRMV